jgi:hypothetical protein
MMIDPVSVATAVKLGTDLFGKVFGGGKERKEAQAKKDAFDTTEANRLAAARLGHGDTERLRTSRAGALGEKLAGTNYDIPAEFLDALQQEKEFTGYQREYAAGEPQGSFLGDLASGISDVAGQGASAYLQGLGADNPNAAPAAAPPAPRGFNPQGPGSGVDFGPDPNCPPGTIC